jgi:hypothetical protein
MKSSIRYAWHPVKIPDQVRKDFQRAPPLKEHKSADGNNIGDTGSAHGVPWLFTSAKGLFTLRFVNGRQTASTCKPT